MRVATLLVSLLHVHAEQVAVEIAADGEDTWLGYMMLQTRNFLQTASDKLQKHIDGSWHDEAKNTKECPGAPVVVNAKPGECFYTGVSVVTTDGTTIQSFFDDNVEMKYFKFYMAGGEDAPIENLAEHPFQVGPAHTVIVEGYDLAGNKKACHRTVVVKDTQKPQWTTVDVEKEVTIYLDDNCQKTSTSVFSHYEETARFSPSGTDNCGVEGVTKQVKQGTEVLYQDDSDIGSDLLTGGPGTYELVYTLKDVYGLINRHTVVLTLKDNQPPRNTEGCPADEDGNPKIFVEVEAAETTGETDWHLPKIIKDNCLEYGTLPMPEEVGFHGTPYESDDWWRAKGKFPVGDTPMAYPMYDSFGNLFPHECKFTVTVKQKAHPVVLTCPEDVVAQTVELTEFGIPFWDPPSVTQGGKKLDSAKHVTYLHGAKPGMPFPYGETVVTVKAVGEITGNRTREEDQMDECTFRVTVKDPFRPYVDGRHFRCGAESAGKTEPFGVCEGSDLKVQMHEGYQETGGYDLVEGMTRTEGSCCDDEKGTSYTCSPSPSSLFKYCKPGSMADPADAAVAKAVPPPAPVPKGSDRPDSPLGDKDDDKWITEGLSKVDNKDVAPDAPKPAPAAEPAAVPEEAAAEEAEEPAAEEAEAPADEAEEPAAEDEEEGAPVEAEDEAEEEEAAEEAAPEEEAAEEAAPEEEAAEEAAPEEEAAEEAAPEEEAAEEAAPEEEAAEEAAPEEEAAAEAAPPAPKK